MEQLVHINQDVFEQNWRRFAGKFRCRVKFANDIDTVVSLVTDGGVNVIVSPPLDTPERMRIHESAKIAKKIASMLPRPKMKRSPLDGFDFEVTMVA